VTMESLMHDARARLAEGDLAGAAQLVRAAADAWHEAGDAAEEARCLRLAAALARHAGRADEAVGLAGRAVATVAEPGEPAEAGVEKEYAAALLAAGRPDDALAAYRRAAATSATPALSLVDGVAELQAAGQADLAERLADELTERLAAEVDSAESHEAASRLALLASARALDRRDPVAARAHAERARAEALAGRSATGYVAAAVALAALADATGDRLGAYASLAVGWATLRDLVGADGARAAFQPHLVTLRSRWGPAAFARVKAAYEATVPRA
jgi:tetratricopeptide (TPR) repeat protein